MHDIRRIGPARVLTMEPDELLEPPSRHAPAMRARGRRRRTSAAITPKRPTRQRAPSQARAERHAGAAARVLRRGRTGQGHRPRVPRQRGRRRSSGRRAAASRRSCAASTACTRRSRAPAPRAGCCSTTSTSTTPSVDVVAVRRAIGMVFQKPNPFPTMSIFDNVAAGLRLTLARGAAICAPRSRRRCAAPACGRRSRTACTSPAPACRAASSSGCASRARSPSTPR